MDRPAPPAPEPVWTAAAVADRLGVAPGTLRSWSRRYGIGPKAHTPGRHRRYTAADLAELDTMRTLVSQGMVLTAAAAIARSQRAGATSEGPDPARARPGAPDPAHIPRQDPVADLTAAAARLDTDDTTARITAHLTEHGVVATWDRLCRPAFVGLDAAVTRDLGCTDAHLMLSWAITTCLRRLPAPSALPVGPAVLLACAAGEQHTLPLETLSAALIERRTPVAMLGPAVPAVGLRHAAHRLRPATVVVWAHRAATARTSLLRAVRPETDIVIAAGPGWGHTALPPSVLAVDTLQAALTLTTQPPVRDEQR